jgi:hypothetical protein
MPWSGYQTVHVELAARYDALSDVAGFAERFCIGFDLDVFTLNPPETLCYGDYDHGGDSVSDALINQGVWEAQESTVVVDILKSVPGLVLDFGAHIGWYAVLAGLFGNHPVIAFEPDGRAVEVLRRNGARNGVDLTIRQVKVVQGFHVGRVDVDVALLKCDIEGDDCHAVAGCSQLFADHKIAYALIEVSPIFTADGRSTCDYVEMAGFLIEDCGYKAYRIPVKGWEYNDAYREEPLTVLTNHWSITGDWVHTIADCRQDNFLFVRPEESR